MAAGTALQTSNAKVGQVQKKKKSVLLHNGGWDPEISASENGVPYNDLVSRRLFDKKMKVVKMECFCNVLNMFL